MTVWRQAIAALSLYLTLHLTYYTQNDHFGLSEVRGPGFDTRSGNILSFLLPLFQEGQLSVTGESVCTKYWLTA